MGNTKLEELESTARWLEERNDLNRRIMAIEHLIALRGKSAQLLEKRRGLLARKWIAMKRMSRDKDHEAFEKRHRRALARIGKGGAGFSPSYFEVEWGIEPQWKQKLMTTATIKKLIEFVKEFNEFEDAAVRRFVSFAKNPQPNEVGKLARKFDFDRKFPPLKYDVSSGKEKYKRLSLMYTELLGHDVKTTAASEKRMKLFEQYLKELLVEFDDDPKTTAALQRVAKEMRRNARFKGAMELLFPYEIGKGRDQDAYTTIEFLKTAQSILDDDEYLRSKGFDPQGE